jgi:hypothetical protein
VGRMASRRYRQVEKDTHFPAAGLGGKCVANSLCPGQERCSMRTAEGQIGNSG